MSTTTNVTEFDDGSQMVTTETSETVILDENGDPIDLEAEILEVEAVEDVTDAAVEIARIEAERDITIAAIQAETTTAAIEAETESQDTWQQNIEMQLAATQEQNRQIMERLDLLTQVELQEVQQSQSENLEPESVEVTPGNPVAEPGETESAPEPPKRPRKSRWI